MPNKRSVKTRKRIREEEQPGIEVQAIPAPTILWHPSVPLEKLVSDFAEYRDSIIVD